MDERGPYKDIHLLCFNSRLRGVLNIREDISVFSHFTANMWRQVDEFRIEHNDRENSFEFKITQSWHFKNLPILGGISRIIQNLRKINSD